MFYVANYVYIAIFMQCELITYAKKYVIHTLLQHQSQSMACLGIAI